MNPTKAESFKNRTGAVEFTISVFGTEQKHTLPVDMTIEEFKSFVLSLTNNEVFDLKHMMSNKSTLGDLKSKTVAWNTKFSESSETIEVLKRDYEKKYFTLYYTKDGKVGKIEKLRLKDKLTYLKDKLGKPAEGNAFFLMFADGVTDV